MDKARLYQDGRIGPRVYASAIGEEPWWRRQKVALVCAFCVAPVVSQRASVGRVSRPALFRLAQDRQHETACPLNPREVLERIARGARGIAHVLGDELHLVLPGDLQQIDDSVPPGVADPHVGEPVGVNVSTVRPLLPPLINSAVVIARFLQKHGWDPDVAARFKVRRPGERDAVGWDEFCYGPDDHDRLYALLSGGRRPAHPVAVFGRIRSLGKDSLERPVVRLGDGAGFAVCIRSEHPSLLDRLTVGDYVLVVGAWKVWTPQRGRRQTELQAFVDHHWQLSHWSYDDATGRHGPPVCPPPLSLPQRTLRQARTAASRTASPTGQPERPVRTHPRSGRPRPQTPAAPKPAPISSPQPPAVAPRPAPPVPPPPPVTPPTPAPSPPVPDPPAYPPAPSLPPAEPPQPRTTRTRKWWPFGRS